MKTIHFGICCSAHDPAIAIVDGNGNLVFAEATERSLQYKRGLNSVADHFPFIIDLLKAHRDDHESISIAKTWSKNHHRQIKWAQAVMSGTLPLLQQVPFLREISERYNYMLRLQTHSFAFAGQNLKRGWKTLAEDNNPGRTGIRELYYDHHYCHAVAGAFSSPFECAAVAVIDGYGQMTSTAFYTFENNKLTPVPGIKKSKNSLGFFYSFLCQACGFDPDLGEEWKVMGLAPYGKLIPELYKDLCDLIPVKQGSFRKPSAGFDIALYDQLIKKILVKDGKQYSIEDIACTGQKVFEDKMAESLEYLFTVTGMKSLVLVGGCALNSSCNGKITALTSFEQVYVYNAPGDDGTAVGAAILSFIKHKGADQLNRTSFFTPYQGSAINDGLLQKAIKNSPYSYYLGEHKYRIAAEMISDGQIIGWVQGKAEFGPRALGNRSILADPRPADIKDRINLKLKYRESFRPFAPSILEEFGDDIFHNYQPSYYMDKTLVIREAYQEKIKGVTHVNGTGRLQSVSRKLNPGFYQLIEEFKNITGIPVLLNTSFNLAGKPIVHTIDDIMAALYTSGLSAVFVEDYLFTKQAFTDKKIL